MEGLTERLVEVPGRLHSVATGNITTGANEIIDDDLNMRQSEINSETARLADFGEVETMEFNPVHDTVHNVPQVMSQSEHDAVYANVLNKVYQDGSNKGMGRVVLPYNGVAISGALAFDGFVDDVTLEDGTYSGVPTYVVWDTANGLFVGAVQSGGQFTYYNEWSGSAEYDSPDGKFFVFEGDYYKCSGSALIAVGKEMNLLTQEMLEDGDGNALVNTVFVIQYDYDLNGATVTVPEGCVLEFKGGSIRDGSINLNGAKILPDYNTFLGSLANEIGVTGLPAAGTFYFQNGIPTWSNGEDWVDATGTPIND